MVISKCAGQEIMGRHLQGEIPNHNVHRRHSEDEAYDTNEERGHDIPAPLTLPI